MTTQPHTMNTNQHRQHHHLHPYPHLPPHLQPLLHSQPSLPSSPNPPSSSRTTYNNTPYSTPPTTAPPSPGLTSYKYHLYPSRQLSLRPYYTKYTPDMDMDQTLQAVASTTSPSNMHHQSHPHLFPEQIQSASSFRPPSGQDNHPPHQHHQQAQTQAMHYTGPTLQAAHPSAAGGIDIFNASSRHRSASPWVPSSSHHQHTTHHSSPLGNGAAHLTGDLSSASNTGGGGSSALSLFTQSYATSHHPLSQAHTHHDAYSFPGTHYNANAPNTAATHDSYHSPGQSHPHLPYGFSSHSTSSLLDRHLAATSASRSVTPNHHLYPSLSGGLAKYPQIKTESNIRSGIGGNIPSYSNTKNLGGSSSSSSASHGPRTISGGSATSHFPPAQGGVASGIASGSANAARIKHGAGSQTAPSNYGIADETTTTLYDLRDGPDGPTSKPPYPYLTLIRIALLSSPAKRLTLQELYDTLEARWPFFDGESKGWKNSIRHNLSLNKCFKKETRHVLDPGKGSYWYVDLEEEHSTPRVRERRKDETGQNSNASKKSRTKKRKAESPLSGDGEGSDTAGLYPSSGYDYGNYSYTAGTATTSTHENVRSVKLRIGDLKLPFGAVAGASGSGASSVTGGSSTKRQRAISAPSPITPSFFNNLSNAVGAGAAAGGSGHNVVDEHNHQEQLAAAAAPFGVPASSGSNHYQHHNTNTYGSHLQPYAFPSVFNPPIQNPVPKYEFPPAYNTGRNAGTSSNHPFGHTRHTIPAMPSLMADNGPLNSGGSASTFALETPRTIYSAANATARPGTANSINNGPNTSISPGENKPDVNTLEQSMTQMQNAKNADLLTAGGNSIGSGNDENGKNVEGGKKEEGTPGPTPAYVFPATQKGSNEPGQTKRVFVNPPPGTSSTIAAAATHSPGQTNQHLLIPQPQARLQQDVAQGHNVTHTSHTMPNSNLPAVPDHNSSSNPFDVIQIYNDDDAKNRPSPLSINSSSNNKNTFPSLPSATSPTRHLNSEYGDMFSTAPFGLCFDAPSGKSTSTAVRRSSLFNGLTAR